MQGPGLTKIAPPNVAIKFFALAAARKSGKAWNRTQFKRCHPRDSVRPRAFAQPRKLTRLLVLDETWRVAHSTHLENLAREGRAFGAGMAIGTPPI